MAEYPITISETFHKENPDAAVGILIMEQVSNPKSCDELIQLKTDLESSLREGYPNKEALRSLPGTTWTVC
jgi:hypothetical protein